MTTTPTNQGSKNKYGAMWKWRLRDVTVRDLVLRAEPYTETSDAVSYLDKRTTPPSAHSQRHRHGASGMYAKK